MVEIEFTTENLVDIERHLNNYFNGHKPPQFNEDILKLLKKVTIIKEGYQEIDMEEAIREDEED